jgi:hypothetical protein
LPDLGVQGLDVRAGLALLGGRGKDLGGALQQFRLPLRDLVRVHVEALCQHSEGLVTLQGGNRYLRLESR